MTDNDNDFQSETDTDSGADLTAGGGVLLAGVLAFFGLMFWARTGTPPSETYMLVGVVMLSGTALKLAEVYFA